MAGSSQQYQFFVEKMLKTVTFDSGVGDESLQPMLANQFESGNEDEDDDDLNAAIANPAAADLNGSGNEDPPQQKDEQQQQQLDVGGDANQYQVYFYDSKEMVRE
jgi:hypothetical protein